MTIKCREYTFSFHLLTAKGTFTPLPFTVVETADGLSAGSSGFSYGDEAGTTAGRMEVIYRRTQNGFSWTASAKHPERIKGIKVFISPLPVARIMVPNAGEVDLQEGDPGRCYIYPGGYYPRRHVSSTAVAPSSGPLPNWAAQFLLIRRGEGAICISSREYPPRVKKLWIYRRGGSQEIHLYSEADACRRSREYEAPTWYLEENADWHDAVNAYSRWMAEAFGMRPLEQRNDARPWLKELALVVLIHGLGYDGKICHDFDAMLSRLKELASLFPPERTLVELIAPEGRFDRSWPNNAPSAVLGGAESFGRLMKTGRALGFHMMPHLNCWGASFGNPATRRLLRHQIRDSEGRPVSWSFDYDQDEIEEEIFAYISPDVPRWRRILRRKVRDMISRGMDAIYLDQVGTFINDSRHDHFNGLAALFRELNADSPQVQFTCESPTTEISASLCPLHLGFPASPKEDLAEMYRLLFGPYIRYYAHIQLAPLRGAHQWPAWETTWKREHFLRQQKKAEKEGAIPGLVLTDGKIRLDGELPGIVLDWAKRLI